MDPDPPAAMRYTEARLAKVGDGAARGYRQGHGRFPARITTARESEPPVLPARFPNLLVNGAGGIAVGMATNIPPHNLGEVIDACLAYIDNGAITIEELMEIVPGPDFPTGAIILGQRRRALGLSDRPRLDHHALAPRDRGRPRRPPLDRAHRNPLPERQERAGREDRRGRQGQADRRRQRHPRRIEPRRRAHRHRPEARRDARRRAQPAVAAHARRRRASRPTCSRSAAAGPRLLNLRDIIEAFVQFREEVITRRSKFELAKARDRAHHLARPGHRGHQSRRGGADHPRLVEPGRGARRAARARMADRRDRALHRAGRGGRSRGRAATPIACPTSRSARSSTCACTA